MNTPNNINYLEMPAADLQSQKAFFQTVFQFEFTDYGPEYTAFSAQSAGIEGGFYKAELQSNTQNGAALIVFYSDNLEHTEQTIKDAGGTINKATFSFPGGRRFHFLDPNQNEWAVWSDR